MTTILTFINQVNTMKQNLMLLPMPRKVYDLEGGYTLVGGKLIVLNHSCPQSLRFSALRFQQALHRLKGIEWEVVASASVPTSLVGLNLRVLPEEIKQPQGYKLQIVPDGITISGHDEAGVFYGICTLIQILEYTLASLSLPCLTIEDWPDFPARGVMLDVSRDKVPTMQTVYDLIDRLAGWKINQFQLYTEHTFAYRNHPEVWQNASPFTGEEILALDEFCRARYIELVPNQNSFGHMHRWLELPRYRHLAESPHGFEYPWGGYNPKPFSLCPSDPESLALLRSLYDELLPHFTSRQFNVGLDETFDLGQGRHKEEYQKRGLGRVYLDFFRKVYQEVTARGFRMQFWGDIIVQHPELIPELPKDAIALEWGYEATHPFADRCAKFASAGLDFYVCPGTSSWCSLVGRTENALGNLRAAAESGLRHGAIGYLITDWGDDGHWQTLPVSYLGFAMGAAYAWNYEANRDLPVAEVVSRYAFEDPSGHLGRVAYDMGNLYLLPGMAQPNGSALFYVLQMPLEEIARRCQEESDTASLWYPVLDAVDQAMRPLAQATSRRADLNLIRREYHLAARMIFHACHRALLACGVPIRNARELAQDMDEIIEEYRAVWLERNRPGGLADSVARFERAKRDYAG